jgi:hypothetical protein
MADQITDVVIPILRALQADVAVLKESVRRIDGRFASIDSLVAGIYSTTRWQSDELDDHRSRLQNLEDKNNPSPEK